MIGPEDQPLAGIRIVDMTHDWAGPHATRVMADYGAEVIKIEYPPRLCGMRGAYLERLNDHPRWWEINRNKASITLDLHRREHVEALERLIRTADVVVDNSRPGVMERFGLGYDRLKELKPDIIVVCMSAYGATGPESSYAGYGGAIEAISGVQALTAYERDADRMRVREVDVTNGIMGACAVMTALVERALGGEGQYIDLSQREASTWLIGEHLLEHAVNGSEALPLGNRHPRFAPQGCYRCSGDDRWVVISVRTDEEWRSLCAQLGESRWAEDPSLAHARGRRERHDEIDARIASWTAARSAESVMQTLQARGIAAGIVADVGQLAVDPHLESRAWFVSAPGDDSQRYPGFPFRFRRSAGGRLHRRGPDLGADNQRLLVDEVAMDPEHLPSLAERDLGTSFDLE